jgi:hypothetical protein
VKDELIDQFEQDAYLLTATKADYGLRVTVSVAEDGTNIAVGKEMIKKGG